MAYVFDNNIEIFSSRDKIREQIIDFAKSQLSLENFDFNKSSYLSYLINILSVLSANHLYHNSSIWKQFFLVSANQRESVMNISAMLGYDPPMSTPASVNMLMTIPLNFISRSNYVQFSLNGLTDLNYSTPFQFYADTTKFSLLNNLNIAITKLTSTSYTANIREYYTHGDILSNNITYSSLPYEIVDLSDGSKGLRFVVKAKQAYTLKQDDISFVFPDLNSYEFYIRDISLDGQVYSINVLTENQEVNTLLETSDVGEVTVPTVWTKYSSIPLIPPDKYGYVLRNTSKGIRLYFGNGIYGMQPVKGNSCVIRLYLSNGSDGNVIPGSINSSDSIRVQDGQSYKNIEPSVINPEPAVDGEDTPNIDEIRQNAITHVKSNNRLVTEEDYDNFGNIVEDLPVSTSTHILKRSDLKVNEICLFTDLIYNDTVGNTSYVVPTRNIKWILDATADSSWVIRSGDRKTVDGDEYISLFNIEVDTATLDSHYFYRANNVDVPVVISRAFSSDTKLLPTYCTFYVNEHATDPSLDKSYFELYYNKILPDPTPLPDLSCNVEIPWSGEVFNLPHSVSNHKFYMNFADYIPILDIPESNQTLKFTIYDVSDATNHQILSICLVDVTIVRDLDDYMRSTIKYDSTTGDYWVYDTPVVLKDYWDTIDTTEFNYYVMSKIIAFDMGKYRMLTDFVNLKFANTTGLMQNMKLNPVNRDAVDGLNPSDITVLAASTGDRYAVSNSTNPWSREPGFIAIKSSYTPSGWLFETINVNDMFYDRETSDYYVYNGESFVEPVQNIPCELKIVVWMDRTYSGTDSALVQRVKDTLVNTLYPQFGYQHTLLISEITRIVKSIDGVSNCRVLKPEHDIIFNYEYSDLTETQLLEYTPELIFFDSNSIEIDLRI